MNTWNRLVKVSARADDGVTIHTAGYDGRGRRLKKVVTNTGQHDGTVVFYYDGWKLIETRDGSGNLYQQFIHGTQYIDELVMMRVKDKGDLYVHQDANWNVIALTDLGGHVVERYTYTPYGQMTVQQVTSYGDRDGDRVVDSTDKGTPGTTCSGTVAGSCRIVDLDFDGDYDATDATLFDNLTQGQARHPDRTTTGVNFPFGHQGLWYDAELESYQNRHRLYSPAQKRFIQRDPKGYVDGMNIYLARGANPTRQTDHSGLCPDQCSWICDHLGDNGEPLTVDDLDYYAVSLCCTEPTWDPYCPPGAPDSCACRCKAHVCTGQKFAALSPTMQWCTLIHEDYHGQDQRCDWRPQSCSPEFECGGRPDFHWGDSECEAWKRTYNCALQYGSGSADAELACNQARCYTDRLCSDSPGMPGAGSTDEQVWQRYCQISLMGRLSGGGLLGFFSVDELCSGDDFRQ